MNKEDLSDRLRQVVVAKLRLDIEPRELGLEESLIELGLGVDSMSTLDFILTLEREFDIEIDESEINIEVLSSVSSLANYIYGLM